ncbi:MAG: hypothetical protein QOG15_2777 [Solirubrobacteraceae bacterium]|nr:hypothetical protein [Solirubrobacteraceae bacterium]
MSGFGRILEDLSRAGVRYVVVGDLALLRHGVVRATREVDVVIAPDENNLAAVRALIGDWKATRPDGSALAPDAVVLGRTINLSTPHGDLNLLRDPGRPLSFGELDARADERRVDGVPTRICSLADLVALKRMAGRERDLADLIDLEAAHGQLPDSRRT